MNPPPAKDHHKRQRLQQTFLQRITLTPNPHTGLIDQKDFETSFQQFQIAYIPSIHQLCQEHLEKKDVISIKDFSSLFTNLDEKDRDTWTEETWDVKEEEQVVVDANANVDTDVMENVDAMGKRDPGCFLNQNPKVKQRGYCSFIVQHDKQQMERLLKQLPITDLPIGVPTPVPSTSTSEEQDNGESTPPILSMGYGPGIWIFFGRNDDGNEELEGRKEHTDSIQHDGTWHYQMSGVKDWHVRPTAELLDQMSMNKDVSLEDDALVQDWNRKKTNDETDGCTKLDIKCSMGDMLFLNTRLWWHSTTLPGQPLASMVDAGKESVPSVSYARDVYLDGKGSAEEQQTNLTNLDGLYAADDIEAGTVVFRESEMPDCELHRTRENPNCEIVELEDGEGAIVSCRGIKAGEFFCIMESDDSDFDGDEGDFESEEEEEERM